MREPLRFDSPLSATSDSWLQRVRGNLQQLLAHSLAAPHAANGAPLHLLTLQRNPPARSQTASLLLHALLITTVLAMMKYGLPKDPAIAILRAPFPHVFATSPPPPANPSSVGASLGRRGGGGEDNPEPVQRGFLPPHSAIQLAPPRLPDQPNRALPVAVTIFDAGAPNTVTPTSNLGLPQGLLDTNSAGPGHKGIGAGDDGGVGNRKGTGDGEADDAGPYTPVLSMPTCSYCPTPVYTDEARHLKMQGTITLRVKVGADGRASDIRVLHCCSVFLPGYYLPFSRLRLARCFSRVNPGVAGHLWQLLVRSRFATCANLLG